MSDKKKSGSMSLNNDALEIIADVQKELTELFSISGKRKSPHVSKSDAIMELKRRCKKVKFLGSALVALHGETEEKLQLIKKYCNAKGLKLDYKELFKGQLGTVIESRPAS